MGYEGPGASEFLRIMEAEEAVQWVKADFLAQILSAHGPTAVRELAKEHRVTPAYLVRMAKVALAIPPHDRDAKLSFSHHLIAAQAGDWRTWLRRASEADWSTRELRDAIVAETGASPHDAVRRAAKAASSMKSAADIAKGTPAFSDVAEYAEAAWGYVQSLTQ